MAGKPDEEWDDRLEALERSATQHQWMDEPRYKRLFRGIEDRISGVLGAAGPGPRLRLRSRSQPPVKLSLLLQSLRRSSVRSPATGAAL